MPLAHRVAKPVVARSARGSSAGVVRGVGSTAAYVEFDGFVVAVTGPTVPLMPNGVSLGESPDLGSPGAGASLSPGRLVWGVQQVVWIDSAPAVWDPRMSLSTGAAHREAIRLRGAAILTACGIDPQTDPVAMARALLAAGVGADAAGGVELLLRSVAMRIPAHAADAAALLLGHGPGLTPEGDDVLTACIGAVAALAGAAGWSAVERRLWITAAVPPHVRSHTTALSATLIELAAAGDVVEPMHRLLNVEADRSWDSALRQLARTGASTGRAYAIVAGAAAFLCATYRQHERK